MKLLKLTSKISLLFIVLMLAVSCEEESDLIKKETEGTIRNAEDANIVALKLNDILEEIRDDLDYGYTYTDYSPDGTYSVTGGAYSGPIFSGAYTYEYVKNFTVSFNNHTNNGMTIESGTIRYEFTDYSSSGYHLIIEVSSTSGIYLTCQNEDYTITDIINNLTMGDIDDNQYMIWANFRSSNGEYYSVNAY